MIARDKLQHLIAGVLITLALSLELPLWIAVLAGMFAGFVKECYDYAHPDTHTCDGMDFIATAAGSVAVGLILIGFK